MSAAPHIKLIAVVVAESCADSVHLTNLLAEVFGSVDYVGDARTYASTTHTQKTHGVGLVKWLISFTGPHYADILPAAKRACIELERGCSLEYSGEHTTPNSTAANESPCPTITIDIGYLDLHKVVLARTEPDGQPLYLDDGVYGDLIVYRTDNTWSPSPWSSLDTYPTHHYEDLSAVYSLFMRAHRADKKIL